MSELNTIPNILIGGAPKCGTSSLFDWLTQHRLIQGSKPKEPFVLMDYNHPLYNAELDFKNNGWGCYSKIFETEEGCLYLEGSTHYIYQTDIISKLNQLEVKPFVIFVLRNPTDRLYSSFVYSKNNLSSIDSNITFENYIEKMLNGEKLEVGSIPSKYVLNRDLNYGRYSEFLYTWFDKYDVNLIKVVFFEDLISNPKKVVSEIFKFIGIEGEIDSIKFERKNESKDVKNKKVHRFLQGINRSINDSAIKRILKNWYFKLQKSNEEEYFPLELRNRINEYYFQCNKELSTLLNKDLSKWEK